MFEGEGSDDFESAEESPVEAPSRNPDPKKNNRLVDEGSGLSEDEGSDSSDDDSVEEIETGRTKVRKVTRRIEEVSSEDDDDDDGEPGDIEDEEESGNFKSLSLKRRQYWFE